MEELNAEMDNLKTKCVYYSSCCFGEMTRVVKLFDLDERTIRGCGWELWEIQLRFEWALSKNSRKSSKKQEGHEDGRDVTSCVLIRVCVGISAHQ